MMMSRKWRWWKEEREKKVRDGVWDETRRRLREGEGEGQEMETYKRHHSVEMIWLSEERELGERGKGERR